MNSKKIIFSLLFLTLGVFGVAQEKINWTKIDKVEKQMAKKENANKKYFVDCYTDWCGWCKKMDKDTFSDTLIAKLMNHYFVASKFDAEEKDDVVIMGKTYQNPNYNANAKRKTTHQLANYLLNIVFLILLILFWIRILISLLLYLDIILRKSLKK
jgi:thioredoxin-related protein